MLPLLGKNLTYLKDLIHHFVMKTLKILNLEELEKQTDLKIYNIDTII